MRRLVAIAALFPFVAISAPLSLSPSFGTGAGGGGVGPINPSTLACQITTASLAGTPTSTTIIPSTTCLVYITSTAGAVTVTANGTGGIVLAAPANSKDGTQVTVLNATTNNIILNTSGTNVASIVTDYNPILYNQGGFCLFTWLAAQTIWITTSCNTVDANQIQSGVIPVTRGGTNLGTLTNHALQVGAGTSSVTQLAVGTTGQVLNANTGADPSWGTAPASGEINFSGYNTANLGNATAFTQTKFTNASTLTTDSTVTIDLVGVGGGSLVLKLCSDVTTCGAGNVYLTCTVSCTATAGTITACVATKPAVSAATVLTWGIATSCATTDPFFNVNAHATIP